jgi:hypothetical protein
VPQAEPRNPSSEVGERGPAGDKITQMMEAIEDDLKNGVFTPDDLRGKNRRKWPQKEFVDRYSSIGKRTTFREACKRVLEKLETAPGNSAKLRQTPPTNK